MFIQDIKIFLSLLVLCLLIKSTVQSTKDEINLLLRQSYKDLDWQIFSVLVDNAEMGGFFTIGEMEHFFSFLVENSPELMSPGKIIGHSYENRELKVYCLSEKSEKSTDRPMIFLTALHHAREPLSLTMTLYTFLRIVIEYKKGNPEMVQLLAHNQICALPIINIDGYARIEEIYRKTHKLQEIRKNRSPSKCNDLEMGVDLNRNYDFHWNSNLGSSPNECNEEYRGPKPFSEPETQAIKGFVEDNLSKIKLAINFHAYGNLWIYPFNCCPDMKMPTNRIKSIYDDFRENADFPAKALIGNAQQTIKYIANGEASDWLLGVHQIITLSPELGTSAKSAQTFFPNREDVKNALDEDFKTIWYLFSKLNPVIEKVQKNSDRTPEGEYRLNFTLFNRAYRDIADCQIDLDLELIHPECYATVLIQIEEYDEDATINSYQQIFSNQTSKDNINRYSLTQPLSCKTWEYLKVELKLNCLNFENGQVSLKISGDSQTYFLEETEIKGKFSMKTLLAWLLILLLMMVIGLVIYILKRNKPETSNYSLTVTNEYEFQNLEESNQVASAQI